MYLGRVTGTVVAERKAAGLAGSKLMLVQPLDEHLAPAGDVHVAVDTVQAGVGDLVYLVGSREAALALDPWFVPVDAAIVGIVDDVHTPERHTRTDDGTRVNGGRTRGDQPRARDSGAQTMHPPMDRADRAAELTRADGAAELTLAETTETADAATATTATAAAADTDRPAPPRRPMASVPPGGKS